MTGGEDIAKNKVARFDLIKNHFANKIQVLTYPDPTHKITQDTTLIGDSGATDLFVTQTDANNILQDIRPCNDLEVELPNGQVITSVAEGVWTLGTSPEVNIPGYVFADAD